MATQGYEKRYSRRRGLCRKKILACLAAALVICGACGMFLYRYYVRQNRRSITAGETTNVAGGYRTVVKDGETWSYNNLITTVLYAGVDSTGELEGTEQYSNKERADSISLVIMDRKKGRMTILGINRDAMTQVRRYTLNGTDLGTYKTHIGYAYSYGDGGEASCENLLEAVQTLTGDIPIHRYVVTNRTTIPYLNDLVGTVTVTVPNDELANEYPEMTTGSQVTLDDSNVEAYVRYRDVSEDFSNEGRIQRQESYISAYIEKARGLLQEDPSGLWDGIQEMEDYLQTNITKSQYLDLVNTFLDMEFTDSDFYTLPGEDALGELHDEFHVDEEGLEDLILELFYVPA